MNIFDIIADGYFKKSPDGRRLFYPRGSLGSGYEIANDEDYLRARRETKQFTIIAMVLIWLPLLFQQYVAMVVISVAVMAFYFAVLSRTYLVRGMKPTNEKLKIEEALANQSVNVGAGNLWFGAVASVAATGLGITGFVVDPTVRLQMSAFAVVAAAAAVFFGYLIMLRRRTLAQRSPEPRA